MEELLHIKGYFVVEHVIDRPRQPVGQNGEGFALAMFMLQTGQVFLPCWIIAQEQSSRFGKSPLEVGIADLFA